MKRGEEGGGEEGGEEGGGREGVKRGGRGLMEPGFYLHMYMHLPSMMNHDECPHYMHASGSNAQIISGPRGPLMYDSPQLTLAIKLAFI